MRGTIDDLPSPHSLGATLPALFHEDGLAMDLCAGLDEVLAPVLLTLDCLGAHLDPRTAPVDLLRWLAGWVGLVSVPDLPPEGLRELIASAWQLSSWCGTARGVRLAVRLVLGVEAEVTESGGTTWSTDARPPFPGQPNGELVVRLPAETPRDADLDGLRRLLAQLVPAQVSWQVVRS